jgi:hypothetical protein
MHNPHNPLPLPKHNTYGIFSKHTHTYFTYFGALEKHNTRGNCRRLDFWLVFFYYMFSLAGGEGRPPGQNGQHFWGLKNCDQSDGMDLLEHWPRLDCCDLSDDIWFSTNAISPYRWSRQLLAVEQPLLEWTVLHALFSFHYSEIMPSAKMEKSSNSVLPLVFYFSLTVTISKS